MDIMRRSACLVVNQSWFIAMISTFIVTVAWAAVHSNVVILLLLFHVAPIAGILYWLLVLLCNNLCPL